MGAAAAGVLGHGQPQLGDESSGLGDDDAPPEVGGLRGALGGREVSRTRPSVESTSEPSGIWSPAFSGVATFEPLRRTSTVPLTGDVDALARPPAAARASAWGSASGDGDDGVAVGVGVTVGVGVA